MFRSEKERKIQLTKNAHFLDDNYSHALRLISINVLRILSFNFPPIDNIKIIVQSERESGRVKEKKGPSNQE